MKFSKVLVPKDCEIPVVYFQVGTNKYLIYRGFQTIELNFSDFEEVTNRSLIKILVISHNEALNAALETDKDSRFNDLVRDALLEEM